MSARDFLGGRLRLLQPDRGHRAGTDAVLLAAAISAPGGVLVDAGAGVGTVGLAYAARCPALRVQLVEIAGEAAGFAARNIAGNELAGRVALMQADLLAARERRAAGLADGAADAVVTNPPFHAAGAVRASPDAGRAAAHVMAASLEQWLAACLALLRPGGTLALIHRADALAEILAASQGRMGAATVLPVHPRAGEAAVRILVRGVKGSRARPGIAPGLVLHAADGAFTSEAEALHRGEALLRWP